MKKKPDPNNPSTIWYWNNWMTDPGVRACSPAARGIWVDMLSLAARAEPIGFIMSGPRPADAVDIARLCGVSVEDATTLLAELERNGVFSRDRKGRMYSRRMVKDEKNRKISVKNGAKGGNPALSAKPGKDKEKSDRDNPRVNQPLKPHARASSHPHTHKKEREGGGGSAREAENRPVEGPAEPPPEPPDLTFRERILAACGVDPSGITGPSAKMLAGRAQMIAAARWLDPPPQGLGLTTDEVLAVIAEVMAEQRQKGHGPPSTLAYFDGPMARLAGAKAAPPPAIPITAAGGNHGPRPASARAARGVAVHRLADDIAAGAVRLEFGGRDPFAAG